MNFCDTFVAPVKILSGTFSAFTASIILLVMFDALLLIDKLQHARSSKTNLDLQERFSCATRAQGDERLKVQEQVGRRPKRGGAVFASVDIWALWGLKLGA